MPETTFVNVRGHGMFTVLVDRAYTNISSMFGEAERRLPLEDALSVVNGLAGAYPNAFLELAVEEIPELVNAIAELHGEISYGQMLDRFGVRRTNQRWWPLSDEIHDKQRRARPLTAGILDYNRLENR